MNGRPPALEVYCAPAWSQFAWFLVRDEPTPFPSPFAIASRPKGFSQDQPSRTVMNSYPQRARTSWMVITANWLIAISGIERKLALTLPKKG
jgi:hypothetical protein